MNFRAWINQVDRLASDEGDVLWRHVHLGNQVFTGRSMIIPTQRSNRFVGVWGGTGTGKSTQVVTGYLIQRLMQGASVVMGLMKQDPLAFHSMRCIAKKLGVPFRWFDITPGRSSYVMNGLKPWQTKFKSLPGRVETFMKAVNQGGAAGGESAFFAANDETLLTTAMAKFPEDERFADMAKRFNDFRAFQPQIDDRGWKFSSKIRMEVSKLGNCLPLNPGPETPQAALDQAIDMGHPFLRQEIIVFMLDSLGMESTSVSVAGLMFYNLLDVVPYVKEAVRHTDTKLHKVVLVLDDASSLIAARNLQSVLETARNRGIELVIASQDTTQMYRDGHNIRGSIEANTGLHIIVGPVEEDMRNWIIRTSGERDYPTISWTQEFGSLADVGMMGWPRSSQTVQVSHRRGPVIDLNTMIKLSSQSGIAFARLTKDEGLANYGGQWQPIELAYHISPEDKEAFEAMPWPGPSPHTVVVERETELERRLAPKPTPPKKGGFGKARRS